MLNIRQIGVTKQFQKLEVQKFLADSGYIKAEVKDTHFKDADLLKIIYNTLGFKNYRSQKAITKKIPKLYKITGILTALLSLIGFVFIFIDKIFNIFGLNTSVYIIWILCCVSLYITNKIALDEWKENNV